MSRMFKIKLTSKGLSFFIVRCHIAVSVKSDKCTVFCAFVRDKEKLNGLFKVDLSLRNLKEGWLLFILHGSNKYMVTVNKEVLLHTITSLSNISSALKDHCLTIDLLLITIFFDRKFNLKHGLLPITSFHADYFIISTF